MSLIWRVKVQLVWSSQLGKVDQLRVLITNFLSSFLGGCMENGWHGQKEILQKLTEQKLQKPYKFLKIS